MKLLGNRIIVREFEEEESSIIVLDKQKKPFFTGEIVAVGTDIGLSVGTTVLLNRHSGGLVEWEGEMLQMFTQEDVIAINK